MNLTETRLSSHPKKLTSLIDIPRLKCHPHPNGIENKEYFTLNNRSKILHFVHKHDQGDASTDVSISTNSSTKQRVQQHLQNTANRWWRPIHSSDGQLSTKSSEYQQHIPFMPIKSTRKSNNIPSLLSKCVEPLIMQRHRMYPHEIQRLIHHHPIKTTDLVN